MTNFLPVAYSLKVKPHVTVTEAQAIWLEAKSASSRLLIKVLWFAGLRITEATRLTATSLIREGYNYTLLVMSEKKRRKAGEIPLPDKLPIPQQLGIELDEYIKDNRIKPKQLLFPAHRSTYWRQIRACAKHAGLPNWDKIHPHSFRHGFVYDKASKGVHPYVLSKLARHDDLKTTLGYYQPTQDDLRKAINQ